MELAGALGISQAFVSMLLAERRTWSRPLIDGTLRFLSRRLGRRVTYEEAFGTPGRRAAA